MPDLPIDPERWPAAAWALEPDFGKRGALFCAAVRSYEYKLDRKPRCSEVLAFARGELAQFVAEREAAARRDSAVNPLCVTAASAPVGSLTTDDPPTILRIGQDGVEDG